MSRKRSTRNEAADPQAPAAGGGFPGTQTPPATAAAPAAGIRPAAAKGFAGDPYWGRGGRYIVGPDGIRRPAEQPEN